MIYLLLELKKSHMRIQTQQKRFVFVVDYEPYHGLSRLFFEIMFLYQINTKNRSHLCVGNFLYHSLIAGHGDIFAVVHHSFPLLFSFGLHPWIFYIGLHVYHPDDYLCNCNFVAPHESARYLKRSNGDRFLYLMTSQSSYLRRAYFVDFPHGHEYKLEFLDILMEVDVQVPLVLTIASHLFYYY